MATIHLPAQVTTEKVLNAALWGAQVVLASVFAVDGIINLTSPLERLIEITTWVASVPIALVRLFGAAEILGAVALMLPTSSRSLTRVAGYSAATFAVLILADLSARWASAPARGLVLELSLCAITALVAWARLRGQGGEVRG